MSIDSSAGFRGVHATRTSVWISGTKGTVLRSSDDGWSWTHCADPQGAADLDFRSVWAFDNKNAFAMSSGPGKQSKLYKTVDNCSSWTLVNENTEDKGFWDGFVFTPGRDGIILGDPVRGQFVLLESFDEGVRWVQQTIPWLSSEPAGEGAFAASNSSLTIAPGTNTLYFGTGGLGGARIVQLPVKGGPLLRPPTLVPVGSARETAGVFSLSFRDAKHGVAVGGDFENPKDGTRSAAWTDDGGEHWHSPETSPKGYRSAVAWDSDELQWITVGPTGTDLSHDDGRHWIHIDDAGWNALSLPWVVGPNGHVGRWATTRIR